jgi:anti-sigma regulatory factor (Ser/Thr protein kinase)
MERLSVPGTLDSLETIAAYVAEVAAAAGLDEEVSYRLQLAVDEVVTNIVSHGYAEVGIEGVVELEAVVDKRTLKIYIEDTGPTYDPRQYQRPDHLDLPIEQRKVGGLGVYLAMNSVDKFLYEQVGKRNRHTLVVNRKT